MNALEKYASKRKLTELTMRILMKNLRFNPAADSGHLFARESGDDLIRAYRSHVNTSVADAPLAERLKNYKYWKRTGRVPPLSWDWRTSGRGYSELHAGYPSSESLAARLAQPYRDLSGGAKVGARDYQISLRGPQFPVVSGGTRGGLTSAMTNPISKLDHPYLVPGHQKPTFRGLYTWDEALPRAEAMQGAKRFAGRELNTGRGGKTSTPGVLVGRAPRKSVARHVTYDPYTGRWKPGESVVGRRALGSRGISGTVYPVSAV